MIINLINPKGIFNYPITEFRRQYFKIETTAAYKKPLSLPAGAARARPLTAINANL